MLIDGMDCPVIVLFGTGAGSLKLCTEERSRSPVGVRLAGESLTVMHPRATVALLDAFCLS